MNMDTRKVIHPTIKKCLQHLEVLEADYKIQQIVYMYMETLHIELSKQGNYETMSINDQDEKATE